MEHDYVLAQCDHCALCLAFPVSIANNFATVNSLDGLCESVWLWFCCGPPPAHLWHGWNLVELQGLVKYCDLNSLQIANFKRNKGADHRRQRKPSSFFCQIEAKIMRILVADSTNGKASSDAAAKIA
ncbi:hypothetical protein RvY_18781 [Ramazzottius varieornatus]|uniref:Uncharacterized protein n=1 Tax=Ramazzottius varieornatus TaxID=947166 RepID=A0A1D1W755_RAMVA|nr:hypothetical protein RvY_18781 [Ramazzottius varieornatus]